MIERPRVGPRAELLASSLLFGLMAVLMRRASFEGFAAGHLSVVRFATGLLAVAALFVARPGSFRPHRKAVLAARGLFGGLAVVCYFAALALIPAGMATLLNNLYPVVTTILAIILLGERPTVHLALALVITTVGVVMVLGGGSLRIEHMQLGWGELAGIASGLLGGAAVTAIRVARRPARGPEAHNDPPVNAATVFFSFCLCGLLVSLPFARHGWAAPTSLGWTLAVTGAIVSVMAQLLMTHSLGALTIPESAAWQQLTPATSYIWAAFFLGEPLSAAAALGVAIAISGTTYGAVLGGRPTAI